MPKKTARFYENAINSIVFYSTPASSNLPKSSIPRTEATENEEDMEFEDIEDSVLKDYNYEFKNGRERYVYQPPPPIPQRCLNYQTAPLTPLSRPALRTAPPHRLIHQQSSTSSPTLYNGIQLMNDRRLTMYRHEADFFISINDDAPLAENLNKAVKGDVIDVGECGLVILKYKTSGKFDEDSFNSCAKTFSSFQLETLSDGSSLGKISPEVFQLGQLFYMKILRYEISSKREKKPIEINFKQSFTHVLRTFSGQWPFKQQQIVSTQGIGNVPTDLRRGLSTVIRHVLTQILNDPIGHQMYALRVNLGKSGKNEDLRDLPRFAAEFLKDFCLLAFGYPEASRFASFTYDDLMRENASLGAKLGTTRSDGLANFSQFQQDVQNFMHAVTEKIQRVLHDLRSTRLQEVNRVIIDGEETVIKEFVQDTNYQNPKRKNARKAKEMRHAKEEQQQLESTQNEHANGSAYPPEDSFSDGELKF